MSTLKVNNIIPFSGQTVNIQGNFSPSGSNSTQSLGSVTNPWNELYVSTGSVVFVAPGTAQNPQQAAVAVLKAGGENAAGIGQVYGMMYTETNFGFKGSFSVGTDNRASGTASLSNGQYNTASGDWSHAEGFGNRATGQYSHAEGQQTLATGAVSHTEGNFTTASANFSHAEGINTLVTSNGTGAHAEGYYTIASEAYAHAEGQYTTASGAASHAEGYLTLASGSGAHAEGTNTQALGNYSHAEGSNTISSGQFSHAGGIYTTASGTAAFTHGGYLSAPGTYQTVLGYANVLGNSSSLFVVGAGDPGNRQDGFSVERDNTNARAHVVIPTNSANPANPKNGSMYFNPSTNLMFIYNGSAWRSASFS
jgi:hypothetical protein